MHKVFLTRSMFSLLFSSYVSVQAGVPPAERRYFSTSAGGECKDYLDSSGGEAARPLSTPTDDWNRAWFLNGTCVEQPTIQKWVDSPFELDRFEEVPDIVAMRQRAVPATWIESARGRSMASVCQTDIPVDVSYIIGNAGKERTESTLKNWCHLYSTWSLDHNGNDLERKLSAPYVRNMKIANVPFDILIEKFNLPSLTSSLRGRKQRFWLSPRGMYSNFHADTADNTHVVVAGHKRFLLVYPADVAYVESRFRKLDANGIENDTAQLAELDRFHTAGGRLLDLVLQGGDALYLPKGWGHAVTNLDDSVAVNSWYRLFSNTEL